MHAKGHLRERFCELVDDRAWESVDREELLAFCGQLWNCTDILPSEYRDALDIPKGSTYAQGARDLRRWAERHPTAGAERPR